MFFVSVIYRIANGLPKNTIAIGIIAVAALAAAMVFAPNIFSYSAAKTGNAVEQIDPVRMCGYGDISPFLKYSKSTGVLSGTVRNIGIINLQIDSLQIAYKDSPSETKNLNFSLEVRQVREFSVDAKEDIDTIRITTSCASVFADVNYDLITKVE